MKHIKYFESLKDKLNIEDLLLEFIDSGELDNCGVDSDYKIVLIFKQNTIGFTKLELLDRIISRLRLKYKFIFISYNDLIIDLMKFPEKRYIDYSLLVEAKNILLGTLNKLNVKISSPMIEYRYNGDLIMNFNAYSGKLVVSYYSLWNLVSDRFLLNYSDICSIIKEVVSKKFDIYISKIDYEIDDDDLEISGDAFDDNDDELEIE